MKKEFNLSGTIQEQRKKKTVFFAICATLALLIVMLLVLTVSLALSSGKGNETDEPTDTPISIGETQNDVISSDEIYKGNLLVLTEDNPYHGEPTVESMQEYADRPTLSDGETNSYTVSDKTTCATPEMLKAFNDMAKAFYEKTKNEYLIVSGGYGNDNSAVFSAGTAVELMYYHDYESNHNDKRELTKEGDYAWIYNNAAKYGFVNVTVDGQASNIFRYVGDHATAVKQYGSVEKYVNHLKNNTSPEKPEAVKSGTGTYAVYYLAANGELVVPAKYSYTVCGDNSNGFIVTVKIPATGSSF